MPDPNPTSPRLRTAHVLTMDIADYSLRSLVEQSRAFEELRDVVAATPEFQRAQQAGSLLRLPTGDGIALVFFGEADAPLRCAIEIAHALARGSSLQVRMGIHSGPVYLVEDINANLNVSGSGINLAQRAMDTGDPGHILLTDAAVAALRDPDAWSASLTDLGEAEVKHGVPLHLFSFLGALAGNPEVPSRLAERPATPARRISWLDAEGHLQHLVVDQGAWSAHRSSGPAVTKPRVVLVYQRGVEAEQRLVDSLEPSLAAHDYEVFSGRDLAVGVEWARQSAARLRAADAVVALVSGASLQSERAAAAVRFVGESPARRLAVVRALYTGPLPPDIAGSADDALLWEGHGDDRRLLADLLGWLDAPAGQLRPAPAGTPYLRPSTTVEPGLYLERSADRALRRALGRQASIVWATGARQSGRTWLLARCLDQAREGGARAAHVDLCLLHRAALASPQAFFTALSRALASQLALEADPAARWDAGRQPAANFERFLEREGLSNLLPPVVWALEGLDRITGMSLREELLELFRLWSKERQLDPFGPLSRLTVLIAADQGEAREGDWLDLEDFTLEELAELNRRFGMPLEDPAAVGRCYAVLGGHPALAARALRRMAEHGLTLERLEEDAGSDEGLFADHLQALLERLAAGEGMLEAARAALNGNTLSRNAAQRLRSAGLLEGGASGKLRFRCPLYPRYLSRHLVDG